MTLRIARLGDLCEFVGGGTPSRKAPEYWGGDIPWATVKDLCSDHISTTLEQISTMGLKHSAANIVPSGTVLLVTRVGLGKVAISDIDIAINQDVKALLPREDVRPEYLFWVLKSLAPEIEAMGNGATVKGVTIRDIKEINIHLPPLDEQHRIVEVLNRAARIERIRAQATERLREFIPTLFINMFGDPIENPIGWEQRILGDVSEVQGGLQVTKKRAIFPLERPYLRVANVLRDQLALGEIKRIRLTEKELDRVRLKLDDLLVVEGHGNAAEIGRVAIWDGSVMDCVHQNHLIRVRPDHSLISSEFACAYLNSSSGRQHLLRSGKTTSGLNTITTSDVKACAIFTPPLALQRQYADIVERVREAAATAEFGSQTTSALASSLMADLLGGSA